MLGSLTLSGHRSWCYRAVPRTKMFPRLAELAADFWVTTYIPVSSKFDAVIQITALFDQPCLALFGLDDKTCEAGTNRDPPRCVFN